eukprot:3210424-Alexandrium_andersonii.AAC.1
MTHSPYWGFIRTQSKRGLALARSFDPDMEQTLRDYRDRRVPGLVLGFELHRVPWMWPNG